MATHLPIKAICNPKMKREGTHLISIQYCESPKKRTVIPTDIYIPRIFWNSKQRNILNKPIQFGEADLLNHRLNKMMKRAQDLIFCAKEIGCKDSIQFLKKYHSTNQTLEEIKAE